MVISFIHLFDKHKKQLENDLLIFQKLKTTSLWQLYCIDFGLYFSLFYSSQVLSPPDTALSTILFSHIILPLFSNGAAFSMNPSSWAMYEGRISNFSVSPYPEGRFILQRQHVCQRHTSLLSHRLALSGWAASFSELQLFLAPCAHDTIMNLLPVKYKSNVVWKSRLSRLPSISTYEGWWLRSGALWRSKMKVLLLCWNLDLSHVTMGHGLGYIWLPLSLSLLKEIPNVLLPNRIFIWAWAAATWLRRHIVMGSAQAALTRTKIWLQ